MKEFDLSLKEVIETLLEYSKGKGQIPDLPRFFILVNISKVLEHFGVKINWKQILEYWSINAPPIREPLWVNVVKYLSNLNSRTEIITQVSKRRPLES